MILCIITRGRVGKQFTLSNLPQSLRKDVRIICPPEELHELPLEQHIYEPYPMNYSQKFQWVLDGCDGLLPNKVVILDDDLRFSARAGYSLVQADELDIEAGFADMKCRLNHFPLVGFHPRAMGNNAPPGVKFNSRINAIQGLNREKIGAVVVDQWPILADMVLNLTLLTRGQQNAVICDLFWDQCTGSNAPGGCSLHRTWEQQKEAVLGLQAMFPDFVTVKEKVVKNGWWGDRPRFDFIIQWKRAYEYGKSRSGQ